MDSIQREWDDITQWRFTWSVRTCSNATKPTPQSQFPSHGQLLGIQPFVHLDLAVMPAFRMWIGVTEYLFHSRTHLEAAIYAMLYYDVSWSRVHCCHMRHQCIRFVIFKLYCKFVIMREFLESSFWRVGLRRRLEIELLFVWRHSPNGPQKPMPHWNIWLNRAWAENKLLLHDNQVLWYSLLVSSSNFRGVMDTRPEERLFVLMEVYPRLALILNCLRTSLSAMFYLPVVEPMPLIWRLFMLTFSLAIAQQSTETWVGQIDIGISEWILWFTTAEPDSSGKTLWLWDTLRVSQSMSDCLRVLRAPEHPEQSDTLSKISAWWQKCQSVSEWSQSVNCGSGIALNCSELLRGTSNNSG